MQDRQLTLDHYFNRAETIFAKKEVVTRHGRGPRAGDLRRVGGAVPPPRRGVRRPRHLGRRSGRHLRLEHRPPPRAVLRRPVQRPGAAHPQHPPVPRAGHLHRQPRRGRGHLRRPVVGGAAVAAPRHLRDGAPHRGDGRRSGRGAQPGRRSGPPRLRGPAGRGRPGRVAPARRGPGRVDVLHERHDRQPQGRGLLPPVDLAAHRRRDDGGQPRRLRARHDPAGGADVPRQRLGPGPRRRGLRCQPRHARARPLGDRHRQPDRAPEGHGGGRGAHHLDGGAARAQGSGHLAPAGHPLRRIGRAPAPVGGLPGDDRPARSCRRGA